MKSEEFNTLKLIHDRIPTISFIISVYCYECEMELYHKIMIEDCEELTCDDVRKIMDMDPLLEDSEIKLIKYSELESVHRLTDIVIKFIKYSELESVHRLTDIVNVFKYDYFIIDMRH